MRLLRELALVSGIFLCLIAGLSAQSPIASFPPGMFSHSTGGSGSTYNGPGDVYGSAYAWFSCSRSYSAAYASGSNGACDLVDSATGLTTFTMNILSTGFADAAGAAASTACAVACKVTKAYDQTGNGRHVTQATLSAMPVLTFNIINSLPVMNCGTGGTAVVLGSVNITVTQAYTVSTVFYGLSGIAGGTAFGTSSAVGIGDTGTLNQGVFAATTSQTFTATNATWHAVQGLGSGASGAYNVDGADTAGVNAGSSNISGEPLRICRGAVGSGANQLGGYVAEGGLWNATSNATQRGSLYTNQHGVSGYNGGV